jgi:hypothetical protein
LSSEDGVKNEVVPEQRFCRRGTTGSTLETMESDLIEPAELFRAVGRSGARALLIGREEAVLPSIEDLIRTKRWSARPHDLDDIRSLLWKAKQRP